MVFSISKARRVGVADNVFGLLGEATIRLVLGTARLRARVTRAGWHG